MKYEYTIANLSISCEIPFPVTIRRESKEFLRSMEGVNEEVCDFSVRFRPVEHIEDVPVEDVYQKESRYYRTVSGQEEIWYSEISGEKPYAHMMWLSDRQMLCEYEMGKECCLCYSGNICDVIGLETILLKKRGFILHASFICWQNKAILFTAPSGTGKSTQAELWKTYENAEILNGDRAGIRKVNDKWKASGLPFAGSSSIYRNESADLSTIIVLRKAEKNIIRRLNIVEAIRFLYPEITVHQWDKEQVGKILDILQDLIQDIPIYLLQCLPNQEAVELVKNVVLNET